MSVKAGHAQSHPVGQQALVFGVPAGRWRHGRPLIGMSARRAASMGAPRCQIHPICAFHLISVVRLVAVQIGGYARASYASGGGGGGASRVPRIAGDVTAGSALVSCVPVSYALGAERRRGLPYGGSTRWQEPSGWFTGLRLRCGDCRAAAGGCHCASLMIKRCAAAAAVRPCVRPDPGSPPSSFPQVTCLDWSGRPVLPSLFAGEMRARPALAVLAWSGDGSPVWGCTTTSGDQVPPRTHKGYRQNCRCHTDRTLPVACL